MFQFQTGSIKRKVPVGIDTEVAAFQFQTGSIKSIGSVISCTFRSGFQFQTGSIKSQSVIDDLGVLFRFNSKLVRLKVAIVSAAVCLLLLVVSIPNWFD